MAWDPPWDPAIHDSHAPGVGAGEPRASAATRRVEGAPAAATADGYGPDLLGGAVEALEGLAEFAAGGAARDRGRLAPAGVQALLGVEESTPTRSARDQDGAPRSDSADEPRQSSLGCAEDPRRAPAGAFQCHGTSELGLDWAATDRGVRAGGGPTASDPGPRPGLWRTIFASGQDVGHPGSGHCATLALAKRLCRARDWIDATGMP